MLPLRDTNNISSKGYNANQIRHEFSNRDEVSGESSKSFPIVGRLDMQLAKAAPGATKLRKQCEKVKSILSNVRWDYGPPADVGIIPAGGDGD